MSKLTEQLQRRGFRAVEDAGLPGGWATDGDVTISIQTTQTGGGLGARSTLRHEVAVYDEPAGLISIESQPVATAIDTSHSAAVRQALGEATEGED